MAGLDLSMQALTVIMLSLNMQNCMSFKKIKTNFSVFIAKGFVKLPLIFILSGGRFLGWLAWILPNKRKKIATRNISLCFPKLSTNEQKSLLKRNLISTGQGFSETLLAYWGSDKKCLKYFSIQGLEIIENALNQNKGCILLGCHLHLLELASRVINLKLINKAHLLVRQHNNKVFEHHVDSARRSYCEKTIDKKDMREVLKSLKSNHPVFYIPDQNFSYQCVYVDFFNQPAATVIAPARIAQSTKTPIIPWFAFRKSNKVWEIEIQPPLEFFQSEEKELSLKKMNLLFETQISRYPEQYLWVHRRFKNHPLGKNHLYKGI
jgi:KDO2-lipid IV(A) lauroyltransferase